MKNTINKKRKQTLPKAQIKSTLNYFKYHPSLAFIDLNGDADESLQEFAWRELVEKLDKNLNSPREWDWWQEKWVELRTKVERQMRKAERRRETPAWRNDYEYEIERLIRARNQLDLRKTSILTFPPRFWKRKTLAILMRLNSVVLVRISQPVPQGTLQMLPGVISGKKKTRFILILCIKVGH